jgi:TolB-like protein
MEAANMVKNLKLSRMLFLFIHAATFAQSADSTLTISVYGFRSINVSEDLAQSLQERIESNLPKLGGYAVLSRNDMDKILKEKRMHQSGLCWERNCLIETGSLLGVDKLITGTISQVGRTYSIVLKLIDIKMGVLESSSSRQYSGRADMLFSIADSVVKELFEINDTVHEQTVIDTVLVSHTQNAVPGKEVMQEIRKQPMPGSVQDKKAEKLGKQIGTGAVVVFSGLAVIVVISSIL